MKRLRHPVRAIREPFGTAGLIVACVALILALTGAAFAAAGLTGKQKKEVEKIAKKYAGKPGAAGAQGQVGPQGPAGAAGKDGAQGEKGAKGDTGEKGAKGDTGTAGKSPQIVEEFDPGEPGCDENGGVVYKVEGVPTSQAEICNGKEGKDGSPWTVGTLPPGATETGTWTVSGTGRVGTALSFPIPLDEANFNLEGSAHFKQPGVTTDPECPANQVYRPTAKPGVLCIYYREPENGTEPFVNGPDFVSPDSSTNSIGLSGTILYWTLGAEPEPGDVVPGVATGSFAVTGCEAGTAFPCP